MKKIILISLIMLNFQLVFSQEDIQQTDSTKNMVKSNYLGLRTICYMVADLAKAKEWYAKAFETEPYFDEPFYVGFNIGGYELGLLPEENPSNQKTKNVLSYWGVNEIGKMYLHLIDLGALENEKPFNVGGDLMTATVIDPWGNVIGLIYNPAFKLEE
ncbi:VOC family protein [Bacteroidota bacterium]